MAMFGDGSDGALNVASGTTNLSLDTLYQFTTVDVAASATISTNSTTGSVLYILATESINIDGTIDLFNKVTAGKNTWSVTINGETFNSPSVANGGAGSGAGNGGIGGAQGNGFGGGGAGGSDGVSRGGHGGTGGTPAGSGGPAKSATTDSSGMNYASANGNDGGTSSGGSGAITSWYLTQTGVAGASAYGADGAGTSDNQNRSQGGGGGAGGIAGKAGVHLVLKAPSVTINGALITSGSPGGKGGNGGGDDPYTAGGGGGGGGGGHGGSIRISYATDFFSMDNYQRNGGSGGGGGTSSGNIYNGVAGTAGSSGALVIEQNTAPAVSLDFPDDGSQVAVDSPDFLFTGTDVDNDTVEYQIQVSTASDFTTTVEDATSGVDPGFSGISPYASATQVTYTLQSTLTSGGETYYWRVRARDPQGSNTWGAWADQTVISKPNPPTVISGNSTAISVNSATLEGSVHDSGNGTITERGFVYALTTDPTILDTKVVSTGELGSMSETISDLNAGTNYYWRAFATNSTATSYGDTQTFATLPEAPLVASIYNITFNAASVDSSIEDDGSTVTERGVVYSLNPEPTIEDTKVASGSGAGVFTVELTGLADLTTYYLRSYSTNSQGTSYSQEVSFTTAQEPGPPTVFTGTPENLTATTIDVVGSEVTLDGTQPVTERGVVFGTVAYPTIEDDKVAAVTNGLGTFNSSVTGLVPETLYYLRAYATNSLGTGYGETETFTTNSLFIADEGDGYWTWSPDRNNAVIGRTQATLANSSVNLLLADLNLEPGETYTLHYSGHEFDNGEPTMILQWYDNLVEMQQVILPNQPYTFIYDTSKLSWTIRLFVTRANTESELINGAFKDLYLAKESSFSGFVPFIRKGVVEVKLENNWMLDQRRENTIPNIFDSIKGLGWSPFNIQTTGLGWLDIGDMFTITGDTANKVVAWNTSLTIDGGIRENLSAKQPEVSKTDYEKAGQITKSLRRTQIIVDKNEQEIQSLVQDVYEADGIVNTQFSEIKQDIDSITSTVQSSGGINLIRNSVMYAFESVNEISLENLALEKPVTTSGTTNAGTPDMVTDGVIDTAQYVGMASGVESYVEVDLGEVFEIDTVRVWHDWSDGRTYNSPRTEVSEDGISWYVVAEPTAYSEVESGNGRTFAPINARYVRDYISGNSTNTGNHWVELQVYGVPQFVPNWVVSGVGSLTIQASPESISAGGISGNQFSLDDKKVTQRVAVRKDFDFVDEEDKTYYSISARVKKNTMGAAYIKLSNRNEELTIPLPDQTEYYWDTVSLENILPQDDYFDVEVYSDGDANLQVTDIILTPTRNKREWTQANGETMNTTMAVTDEGVTIRSSKFRNDYTRITALGFEVRKREAGGERVFGFNGDETNVRKLRADNELSMTPLKAVPINYANRQGWAFVKTEEL